MPGRVIKDALEAASPPAETKAPLYTVVDIPNKGRGIIAASPIKQGTLIFTEKPLLTIDHEPSTDYDKTQAEMLDKVADLPQEAQDQIFGLHNAHATTLPELAGIMQTHGFTLDDGGVALFREACFMNHSCRPTVEAEWNAVKGEMNIHASQDVEVGDELTHDYLHTLDTYEVRQGELKLIYGFDCDCVVCSMSLEERQVSDEMREEYRVCEDMIQQLLFDHPMPALFAAKTMLDIIDKEKIVGAHEGKVWFYAQQIALAQADIARARVFGERAYRNLCTFKGIEHPDCARVLRALKLPTKYPTYGDSSLWQTSLADKPKNLTKEEFEEWLWQRAVLPVDDVAVLEGMS